MTNEEKMLDILASMSLRLDSMQSGMVTKEDLEREIQKTNIKIETDIEVKLQALYEGQMSILEQLTPRSRIDDMESEIRFLKKSMLMMSEKLERLEKAQ